MTDLEKLREQIARAPIAIYMASGDASALLDRLEAAENLIKVMLRPEGRVRRAVVRPDRVIYRAGWSEAVDAAYDAWEALATEGAGELKGEE